MSISQGGYPQEFYFKIRHFNPGKASEAQRWLQTPRKSEMIDSGRGTTRAEDAQGTPTQSHTSPSILVYEDECIEAPRESEINLQTPRSSETNPYEEISGPAALLNN